MKKRVKVGKSRLDRFDFKSIKELKVAQMEKPELRESLKKDFTGTLESQGIVIDDDFKNRVHAKWRSTIKSDIRKVADENPASENWYLKRVLEQKPIKLNVSINKETGEKKKTLRRSQ